MIAKHRALMLLLVALSGFTAGACLALARRAAADRTTLLSRATSNTAEASGSSASARSFTTPEEAFGAVASALSDTDILRQHHALHEALEKVASAQVVALLERIDRLPKRHRDQLKQLAFARLCERFPEAATEWLHRQPIWSAGTIDGERYNEFRDIAVSWARFAPEQVLSDAAKKQPGFPVYIAASELPKRLGGSDPEAQIASLARIPAGRVRDRAAARCIGELAQKNPEAALQLADRLKQTDWALTGLLIDWADRDPASALDALATRLPEKSAPLWGHTLVNAVIATAAKREPQLAAEWALQLPGPEGQPAAIMATATWAEKDPIAALTWAQDNGVPLDIGISTGLSTSNYHVQVPAQWSALGRAASEQTEKAAAWLNGLPSGAERERLIAHALSVISSDKQVKLREALAP